MSEIEKDQPKLIVYRGWLDPGKHVWSPFVVKLEARLRFAGVPYITDAGSTRKGPKGKIPYVECQGLQPNDSEPAAFGDSTLIIKRLVECDILPNINAKASPATRAQDLAIRALLEEKLYFYHVCHASFLNIPSFCSSADRWFDFRPGSDGEKTTTKCKIIFSRPYSIRYE